MENRLEDDEIVSYGKITLPIIYHSYLIRNFTPHAAVRFLRWMSLAQKKSNSSSAFVRSVCFIAKTIVPDKLEITLVFLRTIQSLSQSLQGPEITASTKKLSADISPLPSPQN